MGKFWGKGEKPLKFYLWTPNDSKKKRIFLNYLDSIILNRKNCVKFICQKEEKCVRNEYKRSQLYYRRNR